jgi:hypothetical protein
VSSESASQAMSIRVWLSTTFRRAAWAPIFVVACWALAEGVFHAYARYPWLDMPTHFAGGLAIAYFFRTALTHADFPLGPIPTSVQRLLSIALTGNMAIAWEFLEFFSDTYLGTRLNDGVADTLSDLFLGLLGGACILIADFTRRRRR